MTTTRRRIRLRAVVGAVAIAWVLVVVALVAIHVVAPSRRGPLALTQVVEPYVLVAALVVAALGLLSLKRRALLVAVVALLLLATLRYGGLLVSLPSRAPAEGRTVHAMTWNLQGAGVSPAEAAAVLGAADADLVGMQELRPLTADALIDDGAVLLRFPHRALSPHPTVLGMGLLSRHPIIEHEIWMDPPMLRAVVTPEVGPPLSVIVAHPLPARIEWLSVVPVGLDTPRRDASIERIREVIDRELASGRSVVVLGDFNVTEREPAYAELASGLHDAHLEAGLGPGFTWRPPRLQDLPFGLLRIDYLLTDPALVPIAAAHDCHPRGSDHCIVSATFARPAR